MARPLRPLFPGGIYHVTARGNDRQTIFEDDADRALFLIVLASVVARYQVPCHAYCLMGNHYHALLQTLEGNLPTAMRQLNGVYTQRFNRRHERSGHVFQGRYGAQLVDGHGHLSEVCRYIVLNPVRAGLVAHPRDWAWSSYRATAGETVPPGFLTVDWLRAVTGAGSLATAARSYVRFVEAGTDAGHAEAAAVDPSARSFPTDTEIRDCLAQSCHAAARDTEIPRAERYATRPSLAALFDGVTTRAERDVRAAAAVRDHGYAMKAVADFIGRHYVTVSRAVARAERQAATPKCRNVRPDPA
jgi:REP element-mobilizing transposase RayT